MRNKIYCLAVALILALLPVNGFTEATGDLSTYFTDRDLSGTYDIAEAAQITLSGDVVTSNSNAVSYDDGVVTISQKGTYVLTGTLDDGSIVVDVDDSDKVQLVLNGVSISSTSTAAIYVRSADKVFITLAEDSENTISSLGGYVADETSNIDGAIFSKATLTFNGTGTLTVNAATGHGIVSKDDIKITGGTYVITAKGHGIEAKDSIRVAEGSLTITAGKDGLHAENADDAEKGYIYIAGGTFTLTCEGDGISASGTLTVDGGTFDITAGGGSANGASHGMEGGFGGGMGNMMGGFGGGPRGMGGGFRTRGTNSADEADEDASSEVPAEMPEDFDAGEMPEMPEGFEPGEMPEMPEGFDPGEFSEGFEAGERPELPEDFNPDEMLEGFQPGQMSEEAQSDATADNSETSSTSQKGLKSAAGTVINGGTFTVDSADDAFHTDGSLTVNGGSFTVASGDDGFHADDALIINGGAITVSESYEALEGATIEINGGDIDVTASDDGLNASGGKDGSGNNGWDDMFDSDDSAWIVIAGGNLTVNAGGDGIDSNGDLTVTGGYTVVYGPTDNGNAALDFGGIGTITGGTVIAIGSSGMAQNFGTTSTQASILATLNSTCTGLVTLSDSEGNVILSAETDKTYNSVVFSSPDLEVGETYTVSAGDSASEITLDSLIYGSGSGMMGGMGGRGMGGQRNGGQRLQGGKDSQTETP